MFIDSKAYEIENRFKSHSVDSTKSWKMDVLRNEYISLANKVVSQCTDSRETELALTKLEESMFFVNADISRNEDPPLH